LLKQLFEPNLRVADEESERLPTVKGQSEHESVVPKKVVPRNNLLSSFSAKKVLFILQEKRDHDSGSIMIGK
jgi:hypothetical protein